MGVHELLDSVLFVCRPRWQRRIVAAAIAILLLGQGLLLNARLRRAASQPPHIDGWQDECQALHIQEVFNEDAVDKIQGLIACASNSTRALRRGYLYFWP
jgi:hypothetical protein